MMALGPSYGQANIQQHQVLNILGGQDNQLNGGVPEVALSAVHDFLFYFAHFLNTTQRWAVAATVGSVLGICKG